jgi:hypothetical protein
VRPRSSTLVAAVLTGAAQALLAGCGYGSSPLGGPYGGTASSPPPSPEFSSTGRSGDASDSGGGADANGGGDDSGSLTVPTTWTEIFNSYLAVGTIGNCTDTSCHKYPTPKALYAYLQGEGQLGVGGSSPPLTNSSVSCLSWYGGDMPLDGAQSAPQVVMQLDAWAAAGAQDN